MRKPRMLIIVSALTLASLTSGPLVHAREFQPGDDLGGKAGFGFLVDDRGSAPEARRGADDPAGDDRGAGIDDPQPHF